MRHVLGVDAVDLDDLVSDAQSTVGGSGAVNGDAEHEERHGVELTAPADGEAESPGAASQLHGIVLVVHLQHVKLLVINLRKGETELGQDKGRSIAEQGMKLLES